MFILSRGCVPSIVVLTHSHSSLCLDCTSGHSASTFVNSVSDTPGYITRDCTFFFCGVGGPKEQSYKNQDDTGRQTQNPVFERKVLCYLSYSLDA